MLSLKPEERRGSPRHQFTGMATIMFGQDQRHRCAVKDFSDGGVRLDVGGLDVPGEFALLSPPGSPTQNGNYKVVWRLGQNVGAKFVSAM